MIVKSNIVVTGKNYHETQKVRKNTMKKLVASYFFFWFKKNIYIYIRVYII